MIFGSIDLTLMIMFKNVGQKIPQNITSAEALRKVGIIAMRYGAYITGVIGANTCATGKKRLESLVRTPTLNPRSNPAIVPPKKPIAKSCIDETTFWSISGYCMTKALNTFSGSGNNTGCQHTGY